MAKNDTIEVWVAGTKRITYNLTGSDGSTFNSTVSKHGIFLSNNTNSWMDDFAVSSRLTASEHDADGRLTKRIPPPPEGGTSTSASYTYHTGTNFVSKISNLNAGETKYGVDTANGDQKWVVLPKQSALMGASPYTATYFVRDSAGNVLQERKSGYPTNNLQPDTLEDKIYSATAYEYYPSTGLKSLMVDPMGHFTRYDYDGGSRDKGYLTRVDLPPYGPGGAARVISYVRNSDGTVQQETDPTGRITTYEYDNLGRLKRTNYGVVSGTPPTPSARPMMATAM